MKIELKNVKHAAFASQETCCFEASIYIDGVKRGTVRNDGHGGSHEFHPWQVATEMNAYAKTLPARTGSIGDGRTHTYDMDAETLVDDQMTRWFIAKDIKKATTGKIGFMRGDSMMTVGPYTPERLAQILSTPSLIEDFKLKHKPDHILNLMSPDDAIELVLRTQDVGDKEADKAMQKLDGIGDNAVVDQDAAEEASGFAPK